MSYHKIYSILFFFLQRVVNHNTLEDTLGMVPYPFNSFIIPGLNKQGSVLIAGFHIGLSTFLYSSEEPFQLFQCSLNF